MVLGCAVAAAGFALWAHSLPDLSVSSQWYWIVLAGAGVGLVLGPAQALALPQGTRLRWTWAAAVPALWALGWTATTLGGIDVDKQWTVYGAYGAITFSALSGLLLLRLLPDRPAPRPASALSPAEVTT